VARRTRVVRAGGLPTTYVRMSFYWNNLLSGSAPHRRALGFPAAEDLGNMFQYYTEFDTHILPRRDTGQTRELVPGWLTLKEFLSAHREDIVIGL
jgi:hypothetical protein